jgi:hypothetical protein
MELWGTDVLAVGETTLGPLRAGEPWVTPIPVDAESLSGGVSVTTPEDVALVYHPSNVVALAAREWSIWCSVDDADPGENIYLLIADGANSRFRHLLDGFSPATIEDVPNGWGLYGPGILTLPDGLETVGLPVRRHWQAVPRLVGGLEVARRCYLVGGPPAVFVPGGDTEPVVRLDGRSIAVKPDPESLVKLASFDLGPGPHHVDVGPYRLTFELSGLERPPTTTAEEVVGRTCIGQIVPAERRGDQVTFTGAVRVPSTTYGPVILAPVRRRMVLLGRPGQAAECSATMAPWALAAGLRQFAFEPTQRSSYPHGRRPFEPVFWLAVCDGVQGTWVVVQVETSPPEAQPPQFVEPLAREVVTSAGLAATVLKDGEPDTSAVVRARWQAYARSVMEGSP